MKVARRVLNERARVTLVIRPDPNPPAEAEEDTKAPKEKPFPTCRDRRDAGRRAAQACATDLSGFAQA